MSAATLPSPRIPIQSCNGLLDKLKWDYAQFDSGWDEYRTFNFVVTAYHLYADWINNAGTAAQKARKNSIIGYTKGKLLFDTLRDITNSTKHWKLNADSRAKQVVSEVSSPEISDWYAYLIAGPVMYVSVGDARPSMPELADMSVRCLTWIVDGPEKMVPAEIRDGLDVIFRPLV